MNTPPPADAEELIEIDLRNPAVAGLLAWIWPGAGHMYQRRYAKGTLFMIAILSTFFFGLVLGEGRVVYASRAKNDFRWQYFCQLGVGAPALPALVQSFRVSREREPFLADEQGEAIYAPPRPPILPQYHDHLAEWYLTIPFFELGTLYTMIAGLLNVLAIYDAVKGPLLLPLNAPGENAGSQGRTGSGANQGSSAAGSSVAGSSAKRKEDN